MGGTRTPVYYDSTDIGAISPCSASYILVIFYIRGGPDMKTKGDLDAQRKNELLAILEKRFAEHPERHEGLLWEEVLKRLSANAGKLQPLSRMEETGGEPDLIGRDRASGELLFCDCSAESPQGRRSLCYDRAALDGRKKDKPKDDALGMAAAMGIELLSEEQYRELQRLGSFDVKTSSWLLTPKSVRDLGGAIFGDRRYDRVFVYHNGADSYYGARGFRGLLRV